MINLLLGPLSSNYDKIGSMNDTREDLDYESDGDSDDSDDAQLAYVDLPRAVNVLKSINKRLGKAPMEPPVPVGQPESILSNSANRPTLDTAQATLKELSGTFEDFGEMWKSIVDEGSGGEELWSKVCVVFFSICSSLLFVGPATDLYSRKRKYTKKRARVSRLWKKLSMVVTISASVLPFSNKPPMPKSIIS